MKSTFQSREKFVEFSWLNPMVDVIFHRRVSQDDCHRDNDEYQKLRNEFIERVIMNTGFPRYSRRLRSWGIWNPRKSKPSIYSGPKLVLNCVLSRYLLFSPVLLYANSKISNSKGRLYYLTRHVLKF